MEKKKKKIDLKEEICMFIDSSALKDILSFLDVMPSFANFKNEEEVRNEVLKVAFMLSEKSQSRTEKRK